MLEYKGTLNINKFIIILLLCLTSFWLYLQTLGFDFVNYDDHVYTKYLNENFSHGIDKNNLSAMISDYVNANWHPVTMFSFLLDFQAEGGQIATAFHFQNVLLHTINTILVFLLLLKLTSRMWLSAAVAFLFSVHPINIETVAWISERKGLLSTVFLLSTILLYVGYVRSKARLLFLLSIVSYICALLSKPTALSLPFILFLLDYWPLQRMAGKLKSKYIIFLILEKIPFIFFAILIGIISAMAQDEFGALRSVSDYPIYQRIYNIFTSYATYILKTISPYNLVPYYPHPSDLSMVVFAVSFITVIALTYTMWRIRKCQPYLFMGWFWYLIWLLPVIGIIPIGTHVMANRYAYMPAIGLFVIFVWWIDYLINKYKLKMKIIIIPLVFVLVLYASISQQHINIWRSSYALWDYSYSHTERNYFSGYYYAKALFHDGKQKESIANFYDLMRIGDKYGATNYISHYIDTLIAEELLVEARLLLYWAIENNIEDYSIYRELGLLELTYFNNEQSGLDLMYKAISLNDEDARSHHILGVYFAEKNKYQDAMKHLTTALSLDNESEKIKDNYSKLIDKIEKETRVDE